MTTATGTHALLVASSLTMAAGVAAGAFGAHAVRDRVTPELLMVYQTGVLYHLIHGLAALLAGLLAVVLSAPRVRSAGWLFLLGILVFSGSLYGLVLTGVRQLGAVTPVGGVLWLIGWTTLALAVWTRR